MQAPFSYRIREQQLWLSPERCIFWEEEKALILSDLHFGKTGHFRKSGINIPQSVYKDDLHRLLAQVLFFKAEKLVIVGDLTHSIANRELDLFRKWRKDFSALEVHLAKGNHDILDNKWYEEADITVHNDPLIIDRFAFIHDITDSEEMPEGAQFIFSGHVHPIICIRGKGRQSLAFPCFYFNSQYSILPAFSRFTGGYKIDAEKGDKVFAIAEREIIPLHKS